jgi:hypothetical protein
MADTNDSRRCGIPDCNDHTPDELQRAISLLLANSGSHNLATAAERLVERARESEARIASLESALDHSEQGFAVARRQLREAEERAGRAEGELTEAIRNARFVAAAIVGERDAARAKLAECEAANRRLSGDLRREREGNGIAKLSSDSKLAEVERERDEQGRYACELITETKRCQMELAAHRTVVEAALNRCNQVIYGARDPTERTIIEQASVETAAFILEALDALPAPGESAKSEPPKWVGKLPWSVGGDLGTDVLDADGEVVAECRRPLDAIAIAERAGAQPEPSAAGKCDRVMCLECGGYGTGPDRIDGPGEVYQLPCDRCQGTGEEPTR